MTYRLGIGVDPLLCVDVSALGGLGFARAKPGFADELAASGDGSDA
jgi:hypothetical protein